jgi:hypothetical protein
LLLHSAEDPGDEASGAAHVLRGDGAAAAALAALQALQQILAASFHYLVQEGSLFDLTCQT